MAKGSKKADKADKKEKKEKDTSKKDKKDKKEKDTSKKDKKEKDGSKKKDKKGKKGGDDGDIEKGAKAPPPTQADTDVETSGPPPVQRPIYTPPPMPVYDEMINKIPAECVTVAIIMECLLEQVGADVRPPSPISEKLETVPSEKHLQEQKKELEKFGKPDWGSTVLESGIADLARQSAIPQPTVGPIYSPPLYIKNGDFASIRACHLNEILASHIASTQVVGDMLNIKNLVWHHAPEFNKGLYMKLLGNLNQFMYFVPPNAIRFEDMFFILHLLMAAGVEVELRKRNEGNETSPSSHSATKSEVARKRSKRISEEPHPLEGTNLTQDHNYLALNEATGFHFIMTPTSDKQAEILPVGHSTFDKTQNYKDLYDKHFGSDANIPSDSSKNEPSKKSTTRRSVTYQDGQPPVDSVKDSSSNPPQPSSANTPATKSKPLKHIDPKKAATIAAGHVIEDAVELVTGRNLRTDQEDEYEGEDSAAFQLENELLEEPPPPPVKKTLDDFYFGSNKKDLSANKFIACDEQWFKTMNEFSVFKALLECPALLAISDSGALDLSHCVNSYLLSTGTKVEGGDGVLIGQLKNWNFVEEFVPVQMIQLLSEAMGKYFSMQRMYCPFYDTLLFIFNNPIPTTMKSTSKFFYELRTIPEMTPSQESLMQNKGPVYHWFMDIEKNKDVIESLSAPSLIRIIPDEQWMLIPSIKFMLYQEQIRLVKEAERAALEAKNAENQSLEAKPDDGDGGDGKKSKKDKKGKSKGEKEGKKSKKDKKGDGDKDEKKSKKKGKSKGTDDEGGDEGGKKSKKDKKGKKGDDEEKEDKKSKKGKSKVDVEEKEDKKSKKGKSKVDVEEKEDKKSKKGKSKGDEEEKEDKKSKKGKSKDKEEKDGKKSKGKDKGDKKSKKDKKKGKDSKDGEAVEIPLEGVPSLHLADTILRNRPSSTTKKRLPLRFDCYDLGKRALAITSDNHQLFPMDGTVIQATTSRIEKGAKKIQLTISKNGHQSFFYPETEVRSANESYAVCPFFHLVHSNGTIFAFKDLRSPLIETYSKGLQEARDNKRTFSSKKVLFGEDVKARLTAGSGTGKPKWTQRPKTPEEEKSQGDAIDGDGEAIPDATGATPGTPEKPASQEKTPGSAGDETQQKEEPEETEEAVGKDKGVKAKKSKTKKDTGKDDKKKKKKDEEEDEGKDKKKGKGKDDKASKKGKKGKKSSKDLVEVAKAEEEEAIQEPPPPTPEQENPDPTPNVPPNTGQETIADSSEPVKKPMNHEESDWVYPDSELSDDEGKESSRKPVRTYFAPPWDDAAVTLEPMTHSLKITLPSGLLIQVEDVTGPPLTREIRQSYDARGSAKSRIESSRYYTMNGTVIKFMLNGTIQILTARGVTATIRELAISSEKATETFEEVFSTAKNIRIFNGEIIRPNGDVLDVVDGKRETREPMFLFTSGPLPNGEIFRRRQDGVIYLHRHDGTMITHYPDGTRFTSRMVINSEPVEEFEDWVFVGLKYMVEHPNYSTVIFNTLSGNAHLRLPYGDWARVFCDGTVRLSTTDRYSMDVDKSRAVLSYPPCSPGSQDIPNLTAVKLWHAAPDMSTIKLEDPQPGSESTTTLTEEQKKESKSPVHVKIKPKEEQSLRGGMQHSNVSKARPRMSKRKIVPVETLDGERLEEEEDGRVLENTDYSEVPIPENVPPEQPPEEHFDTTGLRNPVHVQNSKADLNSIRFEVREFLNFPDGSHLLCKAVDSWDNRFAVTTKGQVFVDKSPDLERRLEQIETEMLTALSDHCQLPKGYLSGILKTTSSEGLSSATKRMNSLNPPGVDACATMPQTRIFVVKRDMSGYEYLQKSQVDGLVKQSKACRETMVVIDPLPKMGNREQTQRKVITVMEPVNQVSKPHGAWTNVYREPVFRPKKVTSKSMKLSKPADLRWFGYVLSVAHEKRPRFFPRPRDLFLRKRRIAEELKRKQEEEEARILAEKLEQETKALLEQEQHDEESEAEENEEKANTQPTKKGKDKSKGKKDKKSKGQETIKEKKQSVKEKEEAEIMSKKKSKKSLAKDKKKSSRKISAPEEVPLEEEITPVVLEEVGGEEEEEEEMESVPQPVEPEEEPPRNTVRLDKTEIGEYPDNVKDIIGIYDEEDESVNILPEPHVDVCSEKKAIVVRSIVEIPQINEKLQRALLAASASYSQVTRAQVNSINAGKLEDPRTQEEKDLQKSVKQHFIEQNLPEMHLLQQQPGQVLNFHF